MASPQLFYAFTLGMLAAVNPCGFPLLPAYLEMFTRGSPGSGPAARTGNAVAAGACATAGFIALFGVFGVVVEAGWSALANHAIDEARYVMVAFGVAMVAVGAAALLHHPLRLRLPQVSPGLRRRRPVTLLLFGLSYGVASLGCALPLFLGGVATTFTSASPLRSMEVFVSYALGMGTVLSALAVAVALVGLTAASPLRRLTRLVGPLGNALLVAVGVYLAWYWIEAIAYPGSSNPLERVVLGVQEHVASFIDARADLVGALLGIVVVVAVVTGLAGRRPPSGVTDPVDPVDEGGVETPVPVPASEIPRP